MLFRSLCIRMRNVPAIDATGIQNLEKIAERCKKYNISVIFSHVNEQPMQAMEKAGFIEKIGKENFCPHIDDALIRAAELEKIAEAKRTKRKD